MPLKVLQYRPLNKYNYRLQWLIYASRIGFTKPFLINVHTDAAEDDGSNRGDVANRGFCLDYVQLPCNNSRGWDHRYLMSDEMKKNDSWRSDIWPYNTWHNDSGLYYRHIAVVNDDIRVVSKGSYTHTRCGSSDFAEHCNFNRNSPIFPNRHHWR